MATSDVAICNLALSAVGTRSSIASLTEDSVEARECNLHYTPALEAVLSSAHWNFARKQATATLVKDGTVAGTTNPPPPPWLYEYAYPNDCLNVRYILPQLASAQGVVPGTVAVESIATAPVYFILSSDTDASGNDSNVLLTNQPQAILVYTKRITNPNLFDAGFLDAFALYLASRITFQLTGDRQLARDIFNRADALSKAARASNGNEGITVIDSVPDWIRVRGYYSDWAYPPGSITFNSPTNLSLVT